MIPSIMPGTPTHSKITGRLGVAAPTASAARHTCHQGSRAGTASPGCSPPDRRRPVRPPDDRALPPRRTASPVPGRPRRRRRTALAVPGGRARSRRRSRLRRTRLEHAHHGQPDRPAADHDGYITFANLTAHRMPRDRHRLGERGGLRRQPVGYRQRQEPARPASVRRSHPARAPTATVEETWTHPCTSWTSGTATTRVPGRGALRVPGP